MLAGKTRRESCKGEPEYFGPQVGKKRKHQPIQQKPIHTTSRYSQDDDGGFDDDEDGLNEELNEDALREMMYEEAHHYRRNLRKNLADAEEDRFMRLNVAGENELGDENKEKRELEDQLMDQHVLLDVLHAPVKRVRPNKLKRPKQVFQDLLDEQLSIPINGERYKEFIKQLETDVGKDKNKGTCLTCWQFTTDIQRKVHESYGHHCLSPGKIKDEQSFLHYAKLYHHLTWDGIILIIKPLSKDFFNQEKLLRMNQTSHELKTRRENHGNIKGNPPFLSAPLIPLNMVPGHCSATQILEKIQEEKITTDGLIDKNKITNLQLEDGENQSFSNYLNNNAQSSKINNASGGKMKPSEPGRQLNYGPLALGYTAESREKLCKILQACTEEMSQLGRQQSEIVHKLNLLITSQGMNPDDEEVRMPSQINDIIPQFMTQDEDGMIDPSQDMVIYSLFNKSSHDQKPNKKQVKFAEMSRSELENYTNNIISKRSV